MEFNVWIKQQIAEKQAKLQEVKAKLKEERKVRADKRDDEAKLRIKHLVKVKNSISSQVQELKNLQKIKLVRLQTGQVIVISHVEALLKKLEKARIMPEITQHPDGVKVTWDAKQSKGSMHIHGLGCSFSEEIPGEVELPIYEKGDVVECSIRS